MREALGASGRGAEGKVLGRGGRWRGRRLWERAEEVPKTAAVLHRCASLIFKTFRWLRLYSNAGAAAE